VTIERLVMLLLHPEDLLRFVTSRKARWDRQR
jgi:hypothetical protein